MSRGYSRVTVDIDICPEQPPKQPCTSRVHIGMVRQVPSSVYGVGKQRQSLRSDDNWFWPVRSIDDLIPGETPDW